ncbi:4Fe-4S binding protein [Candidatus Contubernalis alkaliaceticus]|uniref:4Fe-4S binding protein n=1 Tax=Candidatus Contubernalis alkaliaceticus TaxID=338645 RepID=UPI001F4BF02A|nr:4Fe-4S binding protein [Candidatus Contubernalis alkalaceticus]
MKRQSIRKTLILISFLLFPITIYYLSPYLIILGALEGIAAGSFVFFALLFVFSLFLGRAYCGWLCPGGGLQECCQIVSTRKAKGGKFDRI